MNSWQRFLLGRLLDAYGPDLLDRLFAEIKKEVREFTQETETDLDNRLVNMIARALK